MKITKPSIRLSEEELSILERANKICEEIVDNCPELPFPWAMMPEYAENANYYLNTLLDTYNDHANEEC